MKTIRFTTFLMIFLMMGATHLFAQDSFSIQGKILDDKSHQPVPFATVSLFNEADSSLITGAVTNEKGEFDISGIKRDSYYLTVSYVGYQNKMLNKIEFASGSKKVDVGNIGISTKDTELDAVVIKEDKLKGQEKVDRTVYNITDKVKEVSTSGIEVLKQIPSVSVDLQENVTLEGRSDILFYVDDVQRDKNFVAQITPDKIERVEIMTNPTSKYDADVSGIIFFYLKKEKGYGLSGSVGVDIPSPPSVIMDPSASLDYGYNNIRIYASDRVHYEGFNGMQETNTIKYSDNTIDQQLKTGKGTFSWMNQNLNYGIDWFINDKNTLNFYGNYNNYRSLFKDFNFDSRQYINEVMTGKEKILQNGDERGKSNYFSLYYKKKFEDPNKELTIQSGYYDYKGDNKNQFDHTLLDVNTDETMGNYYREDLIHNQRNSVELKVDYTQSNDKSSFETGAKSYYQWIDNTQQYGSDASATNFLYNEIRQSAYANYTYKFTKLTLQGGLRSEYSKTDIDNQADNEYFCLLPQLSLKKDYKNSQSLKLNLRRRIYRPGIDELNPFETWYDSLHVSRGNPDLKPSYSNDLEFVYSKNFKSNMISPKLFVKYRTDDFQEVSFINGQNVTETYIDNIGKVWEYGVALNFAFKLTKWWTLNGYTSVSNKIIDAGDISSNPSGEKQEKVSYQFNTNSIMTFFKTWNYFMFVNYNSPNISYQRTNSRDLLWAVGLEKEIFKNAKLQLLYLPPYTKEFTFQKRETKTPELYDSWEGDILVDYLFAFQFNYTFSTGKKVKQLNRDMERDSDGNKSLF